MGHFLFSNENTVAERSFAMKISSRRGLRGPGGLILVLLTLALLLCGCANLKAIRDFSVISAESAAYTAFADDYVNSIERQKRYQSEGQHAFLDEIIKERNAQRPALLAIHKELCDYMNALGNLAADELVDYDSSLGDLAEEIKGIKDKNGNPAFKKEQIDAFGAVSKLLAKAATDAFRQKELKEIIELSNKDLQIVIDTLKQFIGTGYIESLNNEKVAIDKYYRTVISTAEHQPPQQAAIELVKDRFYKKRDAIETRKKAAESYIRILTKIANAHQLLYDKRNEFSSGRLRAAINTYGSDISNLYNAVRALK